MGGHHSTPKCGCGEPVLSDEVCLNSTYYMYNILVPGYSVSWVEFSFGYVIGTTPNLSKSGHASSVIAWYYNLSTIGPITTTKPAGVGWSGGSAKNCFLNVDIFNNVPTFSSYLNLSCDESWPENKYTYPPITS